MSIYTRTGDFGETSLFGGKRIWKCDDLVDLYGSVDELNSCIGIISSELTNVEVKNFLEDIQKDLFFIGACLAGKRFNGLHLKNRVDEMEARIDVMNDAVTPLHAFILPGGSRLSAIVHMGRSVTRRVERKAVYMLKHLKDHPELEKNHVEQIIRYLNRLSDFFFMLARFINKEANVMDIVWKEKEVN